MKKRIATAVVVVAMFGASCAGHQQAQPKVTTTTINHSSRTTSSDAESKAAILKVAYAWANAATRLAIHPTAHDPAFGEYLTGEMLRQNRKGFAQRAAEGLSGRYPAHSRSFYRVDMIALTGDTAWLSECVLDDGILTKRDTGRVLDDAVITSTMRTEAVKVNGRWKLSRRDVLTQTKGITGCAAH